MIDWRMLLYAAPYLLPQFIAAVIAISLNAARLRHIRAAWPWLMVPVAFLGLADFVMLVPRIYGPLELWFDSVLSIRRTELVFRYVGGGLRLVAWGALLYGIFCKVPVFSGKDEFGSHLRTRARHALE